MSSFMHFPICATYCTLSVSLQRRCANNLNQVAVHANTFGVYPEEIAGLQRDYEKLWGQVSDVLMELSVLVEK